MKVSPFDFNLVRAADLVAENDRQRWLLRTYPAGDPRRRSVRRVGSGGVHKNAARPSDRARGRRHDSAAVGAASSSLGVLSLIGLFFAASWLMFFGLVWLAFQVLRWVGNLIGGLI